MAKLNRGRSSDSLDNGGDDVVCSSSGSSSPTYFTSDDENNTDNLFLISGQPLGKPRSRTSQTSAVHTSNIHKVGENSKNAVLLTRQVEDDDDSNLFGHSGSQLESMPIQFADGSYSISGAYPPDISVTPSPIPTGSSYMPGYPPLIRPSHVRDMNNLTVRMCANLLECRSLIETIEFIERNRDIIDRLTNIVTHEAPAFRNFGISNYQIDHSVKESFNPNFWLDREPIVTTADGNCQYHAVSLSLTGSEDYMHEVRLATAIAVIDNREWFDSMLKLIDRGTVLDLVHTIARNYSWGDETTLKAIAVAIKKRIFLYTCNVGKKDYEMVKLLSKEELLDAFREKEYRGGTGIHMYADPLVHVPTNNYIMMFHKSEHFIAVLPTGTTLTMFEPYNPIVPVFS